MTDAEILHQASLFAQYKDAKEVTLRGQGIIDFVRSLSDSDLKSLRSAASLELERQARLLAKAFPHG